MAIARITEVTSRDLGQCQRVREDPHGALAFRSASENGLVVASPILTPSTGEDSWGRNSWQLFVPQGVMGITMTHYVPMLEYDLLDVLARGGSGTASVSGRDPLRRRVLSYVDER